MEAASGGARKIDLGSIYHSGMYGRKKRRRLEIACMLCSPSPPKERKKA